MNSLDTQNWRYLHGRPKGTGKLKSQLADFCVTEILGYEPCGEGEHIYLWTQKEGLNTAFVAENIARFCKVPLRNVTYAGRKDKYSVSQQWFGVHVPGKQEFDWSEFDLDGFQVLLAQRHNKKLRVGTLKGNHFSLRIRQLTEPDEVACRLKLISRSGVPNYFGEQRFGLMRQTNSQQVSQGSNLLLAEKMLAGEEIRNRNKRSMAISALRSWLFNEFVSQRIHHSYFDTPIEGDVFILNGSNSYFSESEIDQNIINRVTNGDILLSAPLWGKGLLSSQSASAVFENQISKEHKNLCDLLESLGLKQERRHIQLRAKELAWEFDEEDILLKFSLPSGCFATSVVRELLTATQDDVT